VVVDVSVTGLAVAALFFSVLLGLFALVLLGSWLRRDRRLSFGEGVIAWTGDGRVFGVSHVGGRDSNEDSLLVLGLPDAVLLAVADGLGGHNAGEVASRIAVDALREVFLERYRRGVNWAVVEDLLVDAYRLAHERIQENAIGEREGMGTTLVSAFIRGDTVVVANTGDSRAWLVSRDGSAWRTRDHSLVQELVDKGELSPWEAMRHPLKNIVTKALGVDFGVDTYIWSIGEGDALLLSSDGLHDYLDEDTIVKTAFSIGRAEEIVWRLLEAVLPTTKDNVTIITWK
jgi:serine/threonine protein phosphatase PrpC